MSTEYRLSDEDGVVLDRLATKIRGEVEAKAGITGKLPVDPILIAEHLGFSVHATEFRYDDIFGMLACEGNSGAILVKLDIGADNMRFAIAHEIAHHLLRPDLKQNHRTCMFPMYTLVSSSRDGFEEVRANHLAMYLLTPENEVRNMFNLKTVDKNVFSVFGVDPFILGFRSGEIYRRDAQPEIVQ